MSKQANFFLIGLFVITAFILGLATFAYFGAAGLNRDTAIIISTFKGSANGLREGAKVKAYGVEVGQVRRIMLHRVESTDEVVIPVLLEIDLDHVGNLLGHDRLTEFLESECLNALERDAHATLQLDSFVTGLLYVEIVFGQEGDGFILESERFAEYRAMPTIPTDMDLLFRSLQNVATNLGETDFVGLINESKAAISDIRTQLSELDLPQLRAQVDALLEETRLVVGSPETKAVLENLSEALASFNEFSGSLAGSADQTMATLNRTLGEIETTSVSARNWLDPSSAMYNEALQAMERISEAARSMRILAEFIERNPNALITGKPSAEPNP